MRPGIRYLPVPSTTLARSGTRTCDDGPISTIRPSRTTTDWWVAGVAPVIGMTVTFRITAEPWPTALAAVVASAAIRRAKYRIMKTPPCQGVATGAGIDSIGVT